MSSRINKRISLFNFLVILFFGAATIVFLVNNIIRVNELAVLNNSLKEDINKNNNINNGFHTEIERLMSFDNIKKTAVENLKLNLNPVKPKRFVINKSELVNIE